MSKIIGYGFVVEGEGIFPFDMLRYDGCHPRRQEDVEGVGTGYFRHGEGFPPRRKVALVSPYHAPTVDRWSSFGWRVVSQEVIR